MFLKRQGFNGTVLEASVLKAYSVIDQYIYL